MLRSTVETTWLAVFVPLALVWAVVVQAAGPPAVSGSSLTAESMSLVYGVNFENPALRMHLQVEPRPDFPVHVEPTHEQLSGG